MRATAACAGIAVDADSAGTGDWHVGQPPDRRAVATAARHGIDISGLRARQVAIGDFGSFDHLVALDGKNLSSLRAIEPAGARADLSLLLDHAEARRGDDVIDPYFGADEGFEIVWQDIMLGVNGLIARWTGQ